MIPASKKRTPARPAVVLVPEIDIRGVRERMGLSQSQFTAKFGFSAATLRKHPDRVEVVLAN